MVANSAERAETEMELLTLGPEAVEPLIDIAKAADGSQLEAVRAILPRYGPAAIQRLYWAPRRSAVGQEVAKEEAQAAVAQMREAAFPELRKFIEAGHESPLVFAMGVFRRMGPVAVSEVTPLLKHPSQEVRRSAAGLLATLADPRSSDALREALSSNDGAVQMYAAQALGELHDRRSVEILLSLLDDPDLRPRAAAAGALGRMYEPRFLQPLVRLARTDPEMSVRGAAATALVKWNQDPVAQRLGRRYRPLQRSPAFQEVLRLRERLSLVLTALMICLAVWLPMKTPADGHMWHRPAAAWLAVAGVACFGFLWGRVFEGMSEDLERLLLLFCVPATAVLMLLAGPTLRWMLVPFAGIVLGLGVAFLGAAAGMLGWVYGTMLAPKVVTAFFLAAPMAAWWTGRRIDPGRMRSFRYLALLATAAFYAGYGTGWWALWRA
jgi:HEAT repeat protein